jgi:hypothetical protein
MSTAPFATDTDSPQHSYWALRVRQSSTASEWWAAARRRQDVPEVVEGIFGGRHRVEVTPREAAEAMAWASSVDGWDDAEPLFVHQPESRRPDRT